MITPATLDREELNFEVLTGPSGQKRAMLNAAFTALPERLGSTSATFWTAHGQDGPNCGIVFCPHVNGPYGVKNVAEGIREDGAANTIVASYSSTHLSPAQRSVVAHNFKENKVQVLVATKSFGMGIDKPNVRFTMHYGFPQSLEALYQECGRAGRNRQSAQCWVLASVDDVDRAVDLLGPGTAVDVVRAAVANWPNNPDDVTRGLFFHSQSFKGTSYEVEQAQLVLADLGDFTESGQVELSYSNDQNQKDMQQALHRLLILGLCEDFTIDYANRKIAVHKSSATSTEIHQNIVQYVRGYSRGRAATVAQHLATLDQNTDLNSAILQGVEVLVDFIYETIELSRRAALRATWEWCQNEPARLREALLLYLQETEFTEEVIDILRSSSDVSLERWGELVERVTSVGLLVSLEATLEPIESDYPDHPLVFALRGIALFALGDKARANPAQYLEAGLSFAAERYAAQLNPLPFRVWLLDQFEQLRPEESPVPILRSLCKSDDGTFSKSLINSGRPEAERFVGLVRLLKLTTEELQGVNDLLLPRRQHG